MSANKAFQRTASLRAAAAERRRWASQTRHVDDIQLLSDYELSLAAAEARKAGSSERLRAIEAERQRRESYSNPWLRALRIAIAWLVIPSIIGFLIAAITQEHGSIGYMIIGVFIGVIGALVHPVVFLYRTKIRSSGSP
jgi:hypothetical protein